MIIEYGDALAELVRLVQPAVCPELSEEEQELVLDRHQRASIWVASTVVELGLLVIPTLPNRNGHRYKAVAYTTTGTNQQTGTTEPIWSTTRNAQVTDNKVIWEEDGWDWDGNLWDVTAAARDGWLLKASKVSKNKDYETEGLMIKGSQLFTHCQEMADRYSSVYVL